jgi:hypothetical protein
MPVVRRRVDHDDQASAYLLDYRWGNSGFIMVKKPWCAMKLSKETRIKRLEAILRRDVPLTIKLLVKAKIDELKNTPETKTYITGLPRRPHYAPVLVKGRLSV